MKARRNRKARATLLVILGTILSLSPVALARTITVSEADKGHEVSLARGDQLAVSLKTTSGTGYTWKVSKIDGGVIEQAGDPAYEQAGESMPGATWNEVVTFNVRAAGTGELELAYGRPWEANKPPAKMFTLSVIVK